MKWFARRDLVVGFTDAMDDAIAEGRRWLESTDADSKKGASP
jgi:hypothetical protein